MFAEQPQRMSRQEYLDWEELQVGKHELIDGLPIDRWRLRGMSGGSMRHNRLALNIIRALTPRLAGGACEPFGSDVKVETPKGRLRYPDVTVQCGPYNDLEHVLPTPRVIFEVLSPSNSMRRQLELFDDYQAIASVTQIIFVDQRRPYALLSARSEGEWTRDEIEGLEATLQLPSVGTELPFRELYRNVSFDL